VTRFTVEFLRGDEIGRFGTSLTISQWVSLLMFFGAVVYCFWLRHRRHTTQPLLQDVQIPTVARSA
jgi:phosphatidylglycerol:prolipoprotein diacylglycerol transferase